MFALTILKATYSNRPVISFKMSARSLPQRDTRL